MSWNLGWQFGPWEERQAGIHQVVSEVAPDILCVQESWGERSSSGESRSQITQLAETLGHRFFAPAELHFFEREDSPVAKAFTNGIISRWPLTDAKVVRLPKADGTPSFRTAVTATVDSPSGPLRVVTAHISHIGQDDADRMAQASRLAELSNQPNTILAGDLNVTPDQPELALLLEAGLSDTWDQANGEGWTWAETNPHAKGARHPNRRLDYILTSQDLASTKSALAGTKPVAGHFPSDHYALWTDLRGSSLESV